MRMKTSTLLLILGFLVVTLVVSCVGVVALVVLYKGSPLPVAIEPAVGGIRTPPHTGIFIEREGTLVELDRVTRRFSDSSITPLPTFQVPDKRPLLIVYTPGESPSDLHVYKLIERRPLEEIPVNVTPKGSDVVHVQPQQELVPGSYVIHHGEGSPFQNTPAWGFVIGTPTETGEEVATPSVPGATPTPGIGPVLLWEVGSYPYYDDFLADDVFFVLYPDQLMAYEIATGNVLWTAPWEQGLRSRIIDLAHGLIYVQREDNRIYAFNTADGTLAWKFKLEPDERTWEWWLGGGVEEQVVLNGNVINISLMPTAGKDVGGIVAVDALTGQRLWKAISDSPDWYSQAIVAAFQGYVVTRSGGVEFLVDPGGSVSSLPPDTIGTFSIFHKDGLVYLYHSSSNWSGRHGLFTYNFLSGEVTDIDPDFPVDGLDVTCFGETLFFQGGELFQSEKRGVAVDTATGTKKWTWDDSLGRPAWADENAVYFYNIEINTLTAVDLASGESRWQNDEIIVKDDRSAYTRMVGDGQIVVFNGYGLNAQTGQPVWKTDDLVTGPYALWQGMVIYGGDVDDYGGANSLQGVDLLTGEVLWEIMVDGISWIETRDDLLLVKIPDYTAFKVFTMPGE